MTPLRPKLEKNFFENSLNTRFGIPKKNDA